MEERRHNRSKFGYLNYDDIPLRIEEGRLDAYDLVFVKDHKTMCLVTPELEIQEIRAKVQIYDSLVDALSELNKDEGTYEGQLVSVYDNEHYKGYVVNKSSLGTWYLTPLNEIDYELDYNELGNTPITNIRSGAEYVIVSDLPDGHYNLLGNYRISTNDPEYRRAVTALYFFVEHSGSITYVKEIGTTFIRDYEVRPGNFSVKTYITDEYLTSQNFATESYVDEKIAALEFFTKQEAEEFITQQVTSILTEVLDSRIAQTIDTQQATEPDIQSLFE